MFENLQKYHIILASNSPRRKELLGGLGLPFQVRVMQGIDESYPDSLRGEEIALHIAGKKASAYRSTMAGDELIITADTIVRFASTTAVTFAQLTDDEINHYIDTFHPFDKAGAYGIQEWIGYVGITGIRGSFFNVVGLPVQRLYTALKQF